MYITWTRVGVVGEFEYYHCWGLASVHLRTFLSLSVEYWSISRSFPVEEREKAGFKDVSHSNQRRFKGVRECPWSVPVRVLKGAYPVSSRFPGWFLPGSSGCKSLDSRVDSKSLKKSGWKVWKRVNVYLIFAPAKTGQGEDERGSRVHVEAAFWWCWWRSLTTGSPLNEALEKKFEKTSKKIWKER